MPDKTLIPPFKYRPDPANNDSERATLARELHLADGFVLMFALCNSAEERARQIAALREENPDLNLREFALREEEFALLYPLREQLTLPLPNAVCVYGMENWIRSDVPAKSVPFLLNLNAGRNHLVREFPCPIIFWIPEFLFEMIAEAAPDFFSIRSGIYTFTSLLDEYHATIERLYFLGYNHIFQLQPEQRQARIKELTNLLARIRALPPNQQDWQDKASTLDALALLYQQQGKYADAELLYIESLAIKEQQVGREHPSTALTLYPFALLYVRQKRLMDAEILLRETYKILTRFSSRNSSIAQTVEECLSLVQSLAALPPELASMLMSVSQTKLNS